MIQRRPPHKRKTETDRQGPVVWGLTLVLALAILGGSVWYAAHRAQEAPPAPVSQPPAAAPQAPLSLSAPSPPTPEPMDAAPESVPHPPAPDPDSAMPVLDLDGLAGTLSLALPGLKRPGLFPRESTCFRENVSPALAWSGAPPGTQSFTIFLERRPRDGAPPFVSWVLFAVPGTAQKVPRRMPNGPAFPDGTRHGLGDHGTIGYTGPCEPRGPMAYAFRLFALDTVPDLPPYARRADLVRAMNGHILDTADVTLTHFYKE